MVLRYFMLQNGYELIGEVVDKVDYDLRTLNNPWRLLLTGNGYVPVPSPAKELELDRSNILLEGAVDDELANLYRRQTGGIVVPSKGVVIPN